MVASSDKNKILNIKPSSAITPQFRDQAVLEESGIHSLDEDNAVLVFHDVLQPEELKAYLAGAATVTRKSGRSGYGVKPRREICYSPDGQPYVYSRVQHATTIYPDHVLPLITKFEEIVNDTLTKDGYGSNLYKTPSSVVDIIYDETFPLGGSISAHSDDEDEWGMVVVYSLGQTRWFRVRNKETKQWYNMPLVHNSLVVMYGPTFQSLYTHQIDKLKTQDKVKVRLSLNIRYSLNY